MPSRTDRRRAAEAALRLTALALIAALAWRAWRPPPAPARVVIAPAGLAARLAAYSAGPAPDTIVAALAETPPPDRRDWLAALAGAGSVVRWGVADGAPAPAPLAIAAGAVADPRGGIVVRIAAPGGTAVPISDDAGLIDTVRIAAAGAGGVLATGAITGAVRATAPGVTAMIHPTGAPVRRAVMVVGRAGWEAKFVTAALEERGWAVRARLTVAPSVVVETGVAEMGVAKGGGVAPSSGVGPLDTATTSAVVVLDSSADRAAPAIVAFARAGGGVVIAGDAAAAPAFAPLVAGAARPREAGVAGAIASAVPRRGLSMRPIAVRAGDAAAGGAPAALGAIAIERRGASVAVAARRVGAGRVVQVGYDDSWRWRLGGGDDAVARHRDWWSGIVEMVAYTPLPAASGSSTGPDVEPGATSFDVAMPDAAPLAHLVDALGPPASMAAAPAPARDWLGWPALAMVLALLLFEWGSRRARGEP